MEGGQNDYKGHGITEFAVTLHLRLMSEGMPITFHQYDGLT